MTTADPRRPFAGRPPRGQVPPAGRGVLLPDAPVVTPGGRHGRARALARDGFLLLTGARIDPAAVRTDAAAVAGPVRVLALDEIDPDGTLTTALNARPDEVWVQRPDAHIAAVLAEPTGHDIAAALTHAAGHDIPTRKNVTR